MEAAGPASSVVSNSRFSMSESALLIRSFFCKRFSDKLQTSASGMGLFYIRVNVKPLVTGSMPLHGTKTVLRLQALGFSLQAWAAVGTGTQAREWT